MCNAITAADRPGVIKGLPWAAKCLTEQPQQPLEVFCGNCGRSWNLDSDERWQLRGLIISRTQSTDERP